MLDIAEDLLLRDLRDRECLDAVVFKGGTSLRKLHSGGQGRFSVDLDSAVRDVGSGDLTAGVAAHSGSLRDRDPDEAVLAELREGDRGLALRLLCALPGDASPGSRSTDAEAPLGSGAS